MALSRATPVLVVDPAKFVIRSQKGLKQFLRAIHGGFLAVFDPRKSNLPDIMIQADLLTESDQESLSGKGVYVRRDQARKLWFFLNKMRVEDFTTIVLPELCARFPHILPADWKERSDGGREESCCFRHEIMSNIRPASMADLLFKYGCLPYTSYTSMFEPSSSQETAWTILFDALRRSSTQDLSEAVRQLLVRHNLDIPGTYLDILSNGVPCTCNGAGQKLLTCVTQTTPEEKIAAWLLTSHVDDELRTDSASCTTTDDLSSVGHDPDVFPTLDIEAGQCFSLLMLGKSGSGKSTTGNTICGQAVFSTSFSFSSVTVECERGTTQRDGLKIEIVDSPGLFDTHATHEEVCATIVQAVAAMHPGPHAILYVVRLGRYTQEEFAAFKRIKAVFDESITKHMIVLFTHGDILEGKTIDHRMIQKAPKELQEVLEECNNRYIVFNNRARNKQPQVDRLLFIVQDMLTQNGGQTYSCPKYDQIGQGMETEVAKRLEQFEKPELQRQEYVQQLERQIQRAEDTVRKAREEMEENERERQRYMAAEEERRQQLQNQLQADIRQLNDIVDKQREELQRIYCMTERKEVGRKNRFEWKRRAEEQDERLRQHEQKMQESKRQLEKQHAEYEQRRQHLELERRRALQDMEEQRRKEREEQREREEGLQRLVEEKLNEDRAATKRKEEAYEIEMEQLKQTIVRGEEVGGLFPSMLGTVTSLLKEVF